MGKERCRGWLAGAGALILGLLVCGTASAHLERPSYWPDPAPDTSITPAAGGKVPALRSLASAVAGRPAPRTTRARTRTRTRTRRRARVPAYTGSARPAATRPRTRVRVVCQGRNGSVSLSRARASIASARSNGYVLRPSQPRIKLNKAQADRLLRINEQLREMCRFTSIQDAINASGNNDRVVIMPGTYTEPKSRSKPENDPRCKPGLLQRDASGDPTPSYEYQVTCPHDQNLLYVQGRAVVGKPLDPPRSDRRGIPEQELGPCVRCNLQIEGSGAKPEDVIMDAGSNYQGTGAEAKPLAHAKHVVLRVDRADGFVGRNFLMRGALEFGFYTEETDGVLLDRTKFFWNADYGHLSFTSDHHTVQNCDGMGAGDAVIYPGATPETGSQTTDFYPDGPRYNTLVTKCDMRHSALGYSGSMGNAVHITDNHIYGNATGVASDTLSSAGHPGFPTDGIKVNNNYFYSNNFNVYAPDSPVKPLVGVPIGTGIIYAGVNDARVHDNWFFDNWRDGAMLFAVPDALTSFGGPEGDVYPGVSCLNGADTNPTSSSISTSCGNHYFNNRMGQVPAGFRFPPNVGKFGVPHGNLAAGRLPNGNDFWWDEFPSNRWNCWFGNTGADGTPGSVTGSEPFMRGPSVPPNPLPDCAGGTNQGLSVGTGDVAKEAYLVDCSQGPSGGPPRTLAPGGGGNPLGCDWFTPPPRPGSAQAASKRRATEIAAREYEQTPEAERLRQRMQELAEGTGG
jgi:hypothetical protein